MVSTLTQRELEQYLLQSLNMGLGSVLQGETSTPTLLTFSSEKTALSLSLGFLVALSSMMTCIKRFF